MIEAVKVVASVREPAMLEPIPTVVTLNESITITMLETATLAAFCEPRSTSPGPSKAAAVMPRHCAVMAMAAAVTARHCAVMATATMAPAVAAASAKSCFRINSELSGLTEKTRIRRIARTTSDCVN